MENKLRLDIVTPHGKILSEDVDEMSTTGSEGEFGVLPGHMNMVTTLKICMLTYRIGTESKYVFINSGYAEVKPDQVVILADSAELSDTIFRLSIIALSVVPLVCAVLSISPESRITDSIRLITPAITSDSLSID